MKIKKAILAVAGYGTRFLPATKNTPKEMLPIVNKPIVQYLVEEAVSSGIKEIIFVTRNGQSSLENHFDTNLELEIKLKEAEKGDFLREVQKTYSMANFIFTRQGRDIPYGNASPLLCVDSIIQKNEPFVYMFGDDMVKSKTPCVKQLIKYWEENEMNPTIAVQEVEKKQVSRYGIVKLKPNTNIMEDAVEKPHPDKAPKPYYALFGRFILNKDIINIAKKNYQANKLGKDNELWLIDMIKQYSKNNPVYVKKIIGQWMTTGDPLNYMQTAIRYGLDDKNIGKDLKKFIKNLNL